MHCAAVPSLKKQILEDFPNEYITDLLVDDVTFLGTTSPVFHVGTCWMNVAST
jgi:hypothetical protein